MTFVGMSAPAFDQTAYSENLDVVTDEQGAVIQSDLFAPTFTGKTADEPI